MTQQYDVTSVGVNPAKDRAHRMRVYFLTMTLRVLCVISLFWVRGYWIILVGIGAVVLPYIAVMVANAVSHVGGETPEAPAPRELTSADTAQSSGVQETEPSEPTIIVVDAPADRRPGAGTADAASGGDS